MKKERYLLFRQIVAIVWVLMVFVLCTLPSQLLPEENINDKIAHVAVFATLAILCLWADRKLFWTIGFSIFFGVFIECWQALLPASFHRGFEHYDILADAIGALIGVAVWTIFQKKIYK